MITTSAISARVISTASATTVRSRALLGLAVAGGAVGLIALWAALAEEGTPGRGAEAFPPLVLTIGWGFIGAGLFAALRRPDNRIGALMTAVGFAWLLASLSSSNYPLPHTVGLLAGTSWGGFLVHMMRAREAGRRDRARADARKSLRDHGAEGRRLPRLR